MWSGFFSFLNGSQFSRRQSTFDFEPETEVLGPLSIVLFWASPYHQLFKVQWESALNNSFKLASLGVTPLIFFRTQGML